MEEGIVSLSVMFSCLNAKLEIMAAMRETIRHLRRWLLSDDVLSLSIFFFFSGDNYLLHLSKEGIPIAISLLFKKIFSGLSVILVTGSLAI